MKNSDRPQSEPPNTSEGQLSRVIAVKWSARWDVFRRLQTLEINCQCSTNEPLLADIDSPIAAIQIWSVVRQCSESRQDLIHWLNNCWQIKGDR